MKAVMIGGSSGIGLAVSRELAARGWELLILSRHAPEEGALPRGRFEHRYCDLRYPEEGALLPLAEDREVRCLFLSAGFGRVAELEKFQPWELLETMQVNAASTLWALRLFYDRLRARERFYCGVVSSIAGLLVSPAAAVYAASKAAVCRFVESVNTELEAAGKENRILNVAPSAIRGTRFYGGENDLEALAPLAAEITEHLLAGEERFIPDYEPTLRGVLERCRQDPHAFGLESYQYKMASGRLQEKSRKKIGYLSGTFDLFHIGHLNLLRRAKQCCDHLIVGVHESGAWKGKETFIPFEERLALVAACRYVDKAVPSCPEDSDAWTLWHYDRLFVGSDYQGSERFRRYEAFFQDRGVEIIYFPYTNSTSSTQIRSLIARELQIPDSTALPSE